MFKSLAARCLIDPRAGVGLSDGRDDSVPVRIPLARLFGIPRLAVALVLVLVAAFFVTRAVDFTLLGSAIGELASRPGLLMVFIATYTAAFWMRAVAWRHLLAQSISPIPLFSILQAAMLANHLLPVKAGELLRPYLLVRRGAGIVEAMTTTLVARLIDFLCLLLLAVTLLPFGNAGEWSGLALIGPPFLVIGAALTALLWFRWSGFTVPLPEPVARKVHSLRAGLRGIDARKLVSALLWTLPSWMLEATAVFVAAHSMGMALPVHAAIAVTAITILFQVIHVTPGGIGVYEASMTGALALFGVPFTEGAAIALLTHGLKFSYAFTFSLAFSLSEGMGFLRRIKGS